MSRSVLKSLVAASAAALLLTACGSDEPPADSPDTSSEEGATEDGATEDGTAEDATEDPTAEDGATEEPTDDTTEPMPEDDAASEPVRVTDEVSGVSAELPQDVEPLEQTQPGPDGEELTLRTLTASDGVTELGFNVLDIPAANYDLATGLEGTAGAIQGEVVEQREVEVDGYDSVWAEIDVSGQFTVFVQLIATDDYIVQPLVAGPVESREESLAAFEAVVASLELPS